MCRRAANLGLEHVVAWPLMERRKRSVTDLVLNPFKMGCFVVVNALRPRTRDCRKRSGTCPEDADQSASLGASFLSTIRKQLLVFSFTHAHLLVYQSVASPAAIEISIDSLRVMAF